MGSARWVVTALAILAAGGEMVACGSSTTHPVTSDAGTAATDAGDASAESDGSSDAGAADASLDVVDGPGEAGAPCTFNRDCQIALRCECDLDAGCACSPGPRGTGQNGIDRCDSGNECASSVCVEGPAGVYYCSGECVTAADCRGALPVCSDIAFVGRICVRESS